MKSIKRTFFFLSILCLFLGYSNLQAQAPTVTLTNQKNACDGLNNGSIDVTVTSAANPPFKLFILGPANFLSVPLTTGVPFTASALPSGFYSVIVQDSNGGTPDFNGNFTITALSPDLTLALTPPGPPNPKNNSSCVAPNGSINIDVTGGSGAYSFLWSGPTATPAIKDQAGLSAGNYNVVVSDNNSVCTRTFGAAITITDPSPIAYNVTTTTPTVCLGSGGTVNLSNSEGALVTYEVYKGGIATGITLTGTNLPLAFIIPAGQLTPSATYNFTVRAVNGACAPVFMIGTAMITVNPKPTSATLSALGLTTICAGSSTTLKVDVVSGTPNFNFPITNGPAQVNYVTGSAIVVSPLVTTTFDLTGNVVTDLNGCNVMGTGTVIITVTPKPTAVVNASPAAVCPGSPSTLTFTLTGTGPYNVNYSDGITTFNLVGIANGHTVIVNPASTTTYTITSITDATLCPGVAGSNTVVTVNAPPTSAVLSGNNAICAGTPTNLAVTITGGASPYSFTINNGVGLIAGYTSGSAIPVSPLVTTIYSIVGNVVDANGCTVAGSGGATVTVTPKPTATVNASPTPICAGNSSTLTFTLTGTGPFNVDYTDGVTTFNLVGIANGFIVLVSPIATTTYTITSITDATPCPGVAGSSTIVTINTPPTSAVLTGNNSICAGTPTNLDVTIIGGASPYSFTISNGVGLISGYISGTAIPVSPLVTTNYTIVGNVADANGCSVAGSGSANVTVTPAATPSLSGPATSCLGATGVPYASDVGMSAYNWVVSAGGTISNNNIDNITVDWNVAGPQTVSVSYTDAGGCVTAAKVLNVNVADLTVTPTITDNTRCVAPFNGKIDLAITGATGPLTFAWTKGGVPGYSVLQNISNLPPDTYDVLVTDPNSGCSVSLSVLTVNDNSPTVIASLVLSTPNDQCVAFDGALTISTSGSLGVPTFSWSGPAGYTSIAQPITNLNSGVYTVTVTDPTSGCSTVQPFAVVDARPTVTADISGTATICNGQNTNLTFTLSGTGPTFDVTYTDGSSNFVAPGITTGATLAVAPSSSVSYTIVSVKDIGSGCTLVAPDPNITGSADITVTPGASGSISGTTIICNGQSTLLTFTLPVGMFDVVYTDGSINTTLTGIISGATTSVSPAVNTTYTIVSIQDNASLCTVTAPSPSITGTAAVTVNPLPTASISGPSNLCIGQSATLTFTLSAGTFDVVYTDGTSNFTLTGIASGATTNVSPAVNTTYTIVSVTDNATLCSVSAPSASITGSVAINVISVNITLVSTIGATCLGVNNGVIQVNGVSGGSAPYQYSIDNGVTFQFSNTFSSLAPNTYPVVARDNNGCKSPATNAVVTSGITITATINPTNATCIGIADGSITVSSVVGGSAPYTYSNNNGFSFQASNTFLGLAVGNYLVIAKDNSGCQSVPANTAVGSNTTITFTATPTNASCVGINDGQIVVSSPVGGTGPYTYSDGGAFQASATFSALAPASYNIVIKDFNGCSSAASATVVGSNTTITINTVNHTDATCAGLNDGTITVSAVSGGTAPYTYSDDNGVTFQPANNFSSLAPNTYKVVVKDFNGCTSAFSSVIVGAGSIISMTTSKVDASCGGVSNGSITVTSVTGGTPAYMYSSSGGAPFQASNILNNLAANTYSVVVKDIGGCLSNPTSVTINNSVSIVPSFTKNDATCAANDGSIIINNVAGGTGPYTYSINNGVTYQASTSFTNLTVATYFLVVKDFSGCLSSPISIGVSKPAVCGGVGCGAFTVSAINTRPTCSNQNNGTISFFVSGGTPNYIVTLAKLVAGVPTSPQALPGPGPAFTFINLSAADYQYTVQDAVGNSCTLPYTLSIQSTVQATASGFVNANCFNQAVGQATITVTSGGNSPYVYSLDNGVTWVSFTSPFVIPNLMPAAAPYSILVADDPADLCPAQVMVTINNAVPDILITSTVTDATCANNDGIVQVNTVNGGVGPYTYKFDGTPKVSTTFNNLAGGNHLFTVTDANNCVKNFPFVVNFPGLVNFTTTFLNPDCTGNGSNGSITATIIPAGSFDVGITTIPGATPPLQNIISTGNTPVPPFNNLSKGTYYVVMQPVGALCPTRTPVVINGGPSAVDFNFNAKNFTCFETKGSVDVLAIKGSPAVNYSYEIVNLGIVVQSGSITQLQTLDTVNIPGLDKGDYQIRLFQDQSVATGCVTPITSAFKLFTIKGPSATLDTLFVNKKFALPNLPTGEMLVGIKESQEQPYQLMLKLLASHIQGQKNNNLFDSVFVHVSRNTQNLLMEFDAANLYAGSYRLFIRDTLGCTKTYDLNIDFDRGIFIPNIFTPNNDSKNETFYILNLPPSGSNLVITNRWGKEVFHSSSYNNKWDGGAEVDGVYYYRLSTGGSVYTGWVEIMRGTN